MLLLNYAHPLTGAQFARVAELPGAAPEVREVKTQIDQECDASFCGRE